MQDKATRVYSGQLLAGEADGGVTVISALNSGDRIRILGYRLQIHSAVNGYNTFIEGTDGTVISGHVFSDSNGLDYVQDGLSVQLKAGEDIQIRSRTDGTIVWAVTVEDKR